MARTVTSFLTVVAAVAIMAASSALAGTLNHRYSFSSDGLDGNDSVGNADGTFSGDAYTLGGQLHLNDGTLGPSRDGLVDLLSDGANGININTYSSVTIEFWATPNCGATDGTCDPNPNDSFSTAVGLGNTYSVAVPDGPIGAGADYIIMQTHRGNNVSRGAIAVTDEAQGAPWGAETGVDGTEYNDSAEHHYAVVINQNGLWWYVDGASAGVAALANPNSHGNANSLAGVSNQNAWIGTAYTIDQNWAGDMNELRIWSGAANATYIANSYAAGPDQLTAFIPEPASFGLALVGLCSLAVLRRRVRA